MIGRFVGAALQQRIPPHRLLGDHALLAVALVLTAVLMRGVNGSWVLLLVGYANSIMFPTIFSLSIEGLGAKTSRGAGFLVMAIVGGALVPPAVGYLADSLGLLPALATTAICYAYILFFAAAAGRHHKRDAAQA
jgi:FHS family L-fucose permease-like MFS transporter